MQNILEGLPYEGTGDPMKHIFENEKKKPKASGDPDPGSHTGAAAAVAMPAPAPRRKLDKEEEDWVRDNALPEVKGCTITHVIGPSKMKWTAKYPKCGSKSRDYGDGVFGVNRTCQGTLHHVLDWVWKQHKDATGAVCPWDFTPMSD